MILNDKEIRDLAEQQGMIEPFVESQVEEGVISYGLGSFGYDIRIGNQFQIFSHVNSNEVDPKNFDRRSLVEKKVDEYVLIPPQGYILGHSVERFDMPDDAMGVVVGKSTYARAGIIATITPIEAGWRGYLTLEISNDSDLPARVYANEGIAQVLFFRGNMPEVTYDDRTGKYQDQEKRVTTARVSGSVVNKA